MVVWGVYGFEVYEYSGNWNAVGGIYIFAGQDGAGGWQAYYVGQTNSFATRIPNHENWLEATGYGATHVHALVEGNALRRSAIEEQLIAQLNPPINVQHT